MKEHRTRTLRVTTPGIIASREREDAGQGDDPLWAVQLLRLQLQLSPAYRAYPDFRHALGLGLGLGGAKPNASTDPSDPDPDPAAGTYDQVKGDRRRPACDICARSSGSGVPGVPGVPQKRRSPAAQRRAAAAASVSEPESESESPCPSPSPSPSPCSCEGPCAQPLLHLLSGSLDHRWEEVLLALRLIVSPSQDAANTALLAVNGVTVDASRGRVHVCQRDGVLEREGEGSRVRVRSCWLEGRDAAGHTPLLLAGRRLLSAGRWADAAHVVAVLLTAGSDANAVNRDGRSLLSYAVAALDDAVDTTRMLLNHGATVWGAGGHDAVLAMPPTLRPTLAARASGATHFADSDNDVPCSPSSSSSSPVFAWFLRAVIRRRRLDEGCLRTLALVSQVMAERPRHMHSLVLRTMFRHSRCYRVLGPVFLQIKTAMARHWNSPQDLRALCRRTIRRAVATGPAGPAGLQGGVPALGLPAPLQEYLLLHDHA